jgi:hypothetical protein
VVKHLDDEAYRQLQLALMLRPEQGPVIWKIDIGELPDVQAASAGLERAEILQEVFVGLCGHVCRRLERGGLVWCP